MIADEATPEDPLEKLRRILEETSDRAPEMTRASETPPRDPLTHLAELLRAAATSDPALPRLETPALANVTDPVERLAALLASNGAEPSRPEPSRPEPEERPDVTAPRDPLAMLDSILTGNGPAAASVRPAHPPVHKPAASVEGPVAPTADRRDRRDEDRKAEDRRAEDRKVEGSKAEDRRGDRGRPLPLSRGRAPQRVHPGRAQGSTAQELDPADAARTAFRESRRELGERASLDEIIRHACEKLDTEGQTILLEIQLKAMLGQ